jgi:hypothetical protein
MANKPVSLVLFRAERLFLQHWRKEGTGVLSKEFKTEAVGTIADALRDLALNHNDSGNALLPLLKKCLLG